MFQRQGKPAPKVDHSETDWGEFANLTKDIRFHGLNLYWSSAIPFVRTLGV